MQIGGVLTVESNGRVLLDLAGDLIPTQVTRGAQQPTHPSLIHGAASGQQITLIACCEAGGTTAIGQETTTNQLIRAQAAVIGTLLRDADDQVFAGVRVRLSHLNKWANMTGISVQTSHADKDGERNGPMYVGLLNPVREHYCRLEARGIGVSLKWRQEMSLGNRSTAWTRELHATETIEFCVESDIPRAWHEYSEIYGGIQDLVTLATQSACEVGDKHLEIATDGFPMSTADLHYRTTQSSAKDDAASVDTLFTLDNIEPFAESFVEWMSLREKLGTSLAVLFGLDYMPVGYLDDQLFNVAAAAEGMHAALRPDASALNGVVHNNIEKLIKSAVQQSDQDAVVADWVSDAVGSNRPGFSQRCRELSEIPDPEAVKYLLGDVTQWARWLRDARNSVGHATGQLGNKMPDHALHPLFTVTKGLLHLVLMSRLGLGPDVRRA
ncbi:hypothetical protein CH296_26825 [Rhodococcus sp. 14-2496-1d]|nr:hypothetical protein CH296_26825 [Rhodococcus sp. 14-2496-1d]